MSEVFLKKYASEVFWEKIPEVFCKKRHALAQSNGFMRAAINEWLPKIDTYALIINFI